MEEGEKEHNLRLRGCQPAPSPALNYTYNVRRVDNMILRCMHNSVCINEPVLPLSAIKIMGANNTSNASYGSQDIIEFSAILASFLVRLCLSSMKSDENPACSRRPSLSAKIVSK